MGKAEKIIIVVGFGVGVFGFFSVHWLALEGEGRREEERYREGKTTDWLRCIFSVLLLSTILLLLSLGEKCCQSKREKEQRSFLQEQQTTRQHISYSTHSERPELPLFPEVNPRFVSKADTAGSDHFSLFPSQTPHTSLRG